MLTPKLNKTERTIIRRIARMQLKAIASIITGNYGGDLLSYCLELGLDQDKVIQMAKDNYEVFKDLIENPNDFLTLDEDNLSITKHILYRRFKLPKYQEAKLGIWNKLIIHEQFINRLN